MNERPLIDLNTRLALSIDEAAAALGISPNLLREHLHELPKVYIGRRIVIPVDALRTWLSNHAGRDRSPATDAAEEILDSLR